MLKAYRTAFVLLFVLSFFYQINLTAPNVSAQSLQITNISTNTTNYANDTVPMYEKIEISFQVENSVAGNFQFPYDPVPPVGIDPTYSGHQGISVDALFLSPGETDWDNAIWQPAFYYKQFDDDTKQGWDGEDSDWFYPTGEFSWRVRFSPHQAGLWQFKLRAEDASGIALTASQTFTVTTSTNSGFIKVSEQDRRYFEFDDGRPFHGLGFHRDGTLDDPILRNYLEYAEYKENGINFLRIWIGSIQGSAWMRYLGGRNLYDGYLPRAGLLPFYDADSDRATMTLRLDYEPEGNVGWFDACRFQFWNDPEAVKQNTDYRLRIKYRGLNIAGPRDTNFSDFGFVAKIGGWHPNCYESETSMVVTNYGSNNERWQYIEGVWNSGSNDFLPRLHMALENVTQGEVYVDSVSLQEVLGNDEYGPEILVEPSFEYDLYVSQEESYALDKIVELAHQHDIFIKLVLMEKEDKIFYKIADDGSFIFSGPDNFDGFYGNGRTLNKTRWLQQAYWRYIQARWGYSPNIHSWELTNEGDPTNINHYILTDELGKYMHCTVFNIPIGSDDGEECTYDHPNDHLVTTSFWHSFPANQFWVNPNYPNVDYADIHAYVSTGWQNDPSHEDDAAKLHLDYSSEVRSGLDWYATQNGLSTKPVIRGETGMDFVDQQEEQPDLGLDTAGIWLHNFLWSTLDPGGLTELYWWKKQIEDQPGPDGQPGLLEIYGSFSSFITPLPLNNGYYEAINAEADHPRVRVVGQKDVVNQKAHLWIQNEQHTWRNVVDNIPIAPISSTVVITGFQANQPYIAQWWDTYTPNREQQIERTEVITAQLNGDIILAIDGLVDDTAVKIEVPLSKHSLHLPLILKR